MRSLTLVVLISLAVATIVVAYFLVEPAPPKEIRIAAGSRSGAYYPIAQRLAESMRPHGVRVEVIETNGASHNLELMTGEAPPELALVAVVDRAPERDECPFEAPAMLRHTDRGISASERW